MRTELQGITAQSKLAERAGKISEYRSNTAGLSDEDYDHPAGYILQVALFLGMFLNNFATFKEPLKMLAGRLLKK